MSRPISRPKCTDTCTGFGGAGGGVVPLDLSIALHVVYMYYKINSAALALHVVERISIT